jgi:hypothetical protein
MDRIRRLFGRKQAYQPVDIGERDSIDAEPEIEFVKDDFSWLEYTIFLLLGIAMLWAWYALQQPLLTILLITPVHQEHVHGSRPILRPKIPI